MARYLVVAHRTLVGPHLLEEVALRQERGPASFHLVVPVEHPTTARWTDGEVDARAEARLAEGLARFREVGLEADGEVGDSHPVAAMNDALISGRAAGRPFDEVLLSTLPRGPSRWLRLDVVSRAREVADVPVTHLVAQDAPVG